jgi:cyclophilin family peptidyl-prolyl cis-trans isomerase
MQKRSGAAAIQAGIYRNKAKARFPPIKHERTVDTKLTRQDGSLSMARYGPDTATSNFSICIGPHRHNSMVFPLFCRIAR